MGKQGKLRENRSQATEAGGTACPTTTEGTACSELFSASEPVVSVVMTFLNAERFIAEAIESVIAQTYTAWELILVDDGSTDGSTGIARSYAGKYAGQIVYLEHAGHRNLGASPSRNVGIRHSTGRYIAFLDADDAWMPHKLERQVAIMESLPRAAMVYGASRYWHSWTGSPDDLALDHVPDPGVPTGVLFDPPALLTKLYPFGPATTPPPSDFLVSRDSLNAIGGWEEEFRGMYQLYEDQAFLVKMYLKGSIFVSSELWDWYRIHPDSCDAAIARAGHYDSIRAFFLNWFQSYLRKEGIRDPDVWRLLHEAVAAARAQLRTAGGSLARLHPMPAVPGRLRIAIDKAVTNTGSDIQLNLPFYELRARHRYSVVFRARADHPRPLQVGAALAHAPWTGVGLYQRIDLTEEWRHFELQFTATADDPNARIHFDAGESDSAIEIDFLSVRHLPDGQVVEPSLSPIPPDTFS
jgi:glycosyltransferase involved in cell wall biosynthesis